jgi:hypothetical protein
MRTNPTAVNRRITASLTLLCILSSVVARSQTKLQTTSTDMNVVMANIRGLSVGMSARRVLAEVQKHRWTYGRVSTDTLEDIIEKNPSVTSVYLDLNEPETGDPPLLFPTNSIAVHFAWDNAKQLRVVMIRHTYSVAATKYAAILEAAKSHLSSLGEFKETISEAPQFEHRLTYQKVDRSYIMYQLIKRSKDWPSLMVDYTISSY